VFDCYTKPELVRRWLLGPPGWSFLVCEIDLRVGGSYRYVWQSADGASTGMAEGMGAGFDRLADYLASLA